MESLLSVYQRPYHQDFPFICLDEAMKQLVKETRTIEGWRTVEVTKQKTAIDYAHLLQKLHPKLFKIGIPRNMGR